MHYTCYSHLLALMHALVCSLQAYPTGERLYMNNKSCTPGNKALQVCPVRVRSRQVSVHTCMIKVGPPSELTSVSLGLGHA